MYSKNLKNLELNELLVNNNFVIIHIMLHVCLISMYMYGCVVHLLWTVELIGSGYVARVWGNNMECTCVCVCVCVYIPDCVFLW